MNEPTQKEDDKKQKIPVIMIKTTKEEIEKNPLLWIDSREEDFGYYAMLLFMLAKSQKLFPIVEIGVDDGYSTRFFVRAAKENGSGHVYSIDIKDRSTISMPNEFKEHWTFIKGDSGEVGAKWDKGKIGMIFIDGDHTYTGAFRDLVNWYPHVKKGGIIAMHDCIPNSEVEKAYNDFFEDKKVDRIVFPEKSVELALIKKLED